MWADFEIGFEGANDSRSAGQGKQETECNKNSPNIEERDSWQFAFSNGKIGLQNTGFIQQEDPRQMPCSDRTTSQFYSCVGFSEIDKYCNQLLAAKWPGIKNYGDAAKIDPGELPDFDMLCGGVPCQSWSIAGKRKGFEDIRGTMWFEVFRIAKAKKPSYLLLENVKGLLSHNGGKSFERLAEMICEMGYVIDFTVLNSKYFGVPQNRERVFILAIREDMIPKEKVL